MLSMWNSVHCMLYTCSVDAVNHCWLCEIAYTAYMQWISLGVDAMFEELMFTDVNLFFFNGILCGNDNSCICVQQWWPAAMKPYGRCGAMWLMTGTMSRRKFLFSGQVFYLTSHHTKVSGLDSICVYYTSCLVRLNYTLYLFSIRYTFLFFFTNCQSKFTPKLCVNFLCQKLCQWGIKNCVFMLSQALLTSFTISLFFFF